MEHKFLAITALVLFTYYIIKFQLCYERKATSLMNLLIQKTIKDKKQSHVKDNINNEAVSIVALLTILNNKIKTANKIAHKNIIQKSFFNINDDDEEISENIQENNNKINAEGKKYLKT